MKKATAQTQQLEPENYALGLTKSQVQDLSVLSMIAILIFVVLVIIEQLSKFFLRVFVLVKVKSNERQMKKAIADLIGKIDSELNKQQTTTTKETN